MSKRQKQSKSKFNKEFTSKAYTVGILFILLIAVLIFGPQPVEEFLGTLENWETWSQEDSVKSKTFSARVDKVVDGDTVRLDSGQTIRYLNVDTPETKKPGSPIECLGPQASALNESLVAGKKVWLVYDKEKQDRYGRELVFVYLNSEDIGQIEKTVNARLVQAGLAKSLIIKPNNTYERQFLRLEYEAKQADIGIWKECEG